MDDDRIWEFERELWVGGPEAYERKVAEDCVMALPQAPYLYDRRAAIEAVKATPRWDEARFEDTCVERPHEGLIVIAYRVRARRGEGKEYHALCTSTLRRLGHEQWVVIQHQQTPFGVVVAEPG
ncbi:DUF4440 domain-containing protein [Qipengyuania sediminis]|uniref:DUF4440 domain-containing protein n=1 Tax=Qipengyuania sediminis TaxID=1532023 RepID=UPI00105A5209|nr:DUF4440 domain-containing protein [Qipengyuania sediminis]